MTIYINYCSSRSEGAMDPYGGTVGARREEVDPKQRPQTSVRAPPPQHRNRSTR